ncbi:hypothetical protein C8R44DRAFT_877434 [Mycena epipterygia]|nr:hypothetical protein C8R44DRAFT_877434 [Mycena epipterygia]
MHTVESKSTSLLLGVLRENETIDADDDMGMGASPAKPKRKQAKQVKHTEQDAPPPTVPSKRKFRRFIKKGNYCKETVPAEASEELLLLFTKKHDLIAKAGKTAPGCQQLTRQICQTIALENPCNKMFNTAQMEGWPFKIDFTEIPDRV